MAEPTDDQRESARDYLWPKRREHTCVPDEANCVAAHIGHEDAAERLAGWLASREAAAERRGMVAGLKIAANQHRSVVGSFTDDDGAQHRVRRCCVDQEPWPCSTSMRIRAALRSEDSPATPEPGKEKP